METQAGARRPLWGPRRERNLLLAALMLVVIWGFSGSWEFPTIDPPERSTTIAFRSEGLEAVPVSRGAQLFQDNGCYACHSIDGERKIGPSLLGIFGETVEFTDGRSTTVDDAYLLESILYPQASVVAGFEEAAMPSYEGLIDENDARALAEYIKSLN